MNKINMRIRTVIILVIAIGLLVGIGYSVTPSFMASSIERQAEIDNKEASIIMKERLIKYFPGSEEARWEIFAQADSLLQQEDRILIGPNFTGGGIANQDNIGIEKVITYLEKVAKAQNEVMWKNMSYQKMGQLYHVLGDYEQAVKYYEIAAQGFAKGDKGFKIAEVNGSLIEMCLESGEPGDMEKALSLVEYNLENYPTQERARFLVLKGDIFFQLGDFTKAKVVYQEAMLQAEKDWESFLNRSEQNDLKDSNINATLQDQPPYRHSKSRLELMQAMEKGGYQDNDGYGDNGDIKGKILVGNAPMPNVLVYLINEQEYDGRMSNLEGTAIRPPVKTDVHGSFEFSGIVPGRYFVVLGVLPSDLEGLGRFKGLENFTIQAGETKELGYAFQPRVLVSQPTGQQSLSEGEGMKISWQEAPGAKSYNLHLTLKLENGYASRPYLQNLKDTSYVFKPEGLQSRGMNFATWSNGTLGPSAILGSFYPGAEIFFVVEALDESGKSISDSEGYVLQLNANYPSVKITEISPSSHGDTLVLEKKYSEAEQAYLKELEEEPDNPYVLISLARLYNYGWAEGNSNPQKALQYYIRLLEITKEKFIVEEAASVGVQAQDYELALKLFEGIEEYFEEDSFWYHLMGELYFKTGQPEEALGYYQKFLEGQKEFRDLGPVVNLLYLDRFEEAIRLLDAKEYSQRLRYSSAGETQIPADITRLSYNLEKYYSGSQSVLQKEDFRHYLMKIMRIDGRGRLEQAQALEAKIEALGGDDVLVKALIEIARDRV